MDRDVRELAGAWTRSQCHGRTPPSPDLAAYVDHHWSAAWDYDRPYRQVIVPYPQVHLVVRDGVALVQGVVTRHQVRVLEGRGRVDGVAFRPGAFRPFLDRPVSTLTGRTVPAADVLGPGLPTDPDPSAVEALLRERLPEPDPVAAWVADVVALVAAHPGLSRVDRLAAEVGTGVRRLQRLFAEHVGVGPKQVVRRYRLHEATQRLAAGSPVEWADLAAELGYADQAHFSRDFTQVFGEPPTHYARRY